MDFWHDKVLPKLKTLRSLKLNILVMVIIVGFIPSLVMRYGILENYENRAVSVRTGEVQTQLKILANHLITYNYLQDTSSQAINAELDQLSNLYNGRVLIIGNNLKVVKDTYGISEGKTIISEEVVRCFSGQSNSHYDRENGFIEMTIPISDSSAATASESGQTDAGSEDVKGAMLISISTDSIVKTMEILNQKAKILQSIMMIIILAISFLLTNLMVRPLNKVTKAISEVKDGFSDRIEVPDYAETVHIVDAFNQVLARLKILDDTRRDFVANVSHELKTPMTSMKVLADSLNGQEDVPVELYREFMADIASEVDRETKIINDLLSLVKMDKSVAEMNVTEMDMNEFVETVLKRLRFIARKRDIEVTFESLRQVKATVDEVKMDSILTNLVENAIKYNKEHGWVKVVLDADHQFFTVTVSDSGCGIPEESVDHIYERFYRVDKSHSREIGGTGLGLAITRNAVLMHRGSISVESVPEQGTTFTVRIPLAYIKQ